MDERVVLRTEMRGGVPVRGIVAAADVAARHAHPQVHPLAADAQAVFASFAARRDVGDLVEVGAAHGVTSSAVRSHPPRSAAAS